MFAESATIAIAAEYRRYLSLQELLIRKDRLSVVWNGRRRVVPRVGCLESGTQYRRSRDSPADDDCGRVHDCSGNFLRLHHRACL